MDGEYPFNEFRREWKGHKALFRESIVSMKPTLILQSASEKAEAIHASRAFARTKSTKKEPVMIFDSDSDTGSRPTPVATPTKKRKIEGNEDGLMSHLPMTPQHRAAAKKTGALL